MEYVSPEIEIVAFSVKDLITTSGGEWELPELPLGKSSNPW